MKKKPAYIITSVADNYYAESLSVMLTSLLHHTSQAADMAFYIMDMGLSDKNKRYLHQLVGAFQSELHLIPGEPSAFPNMSWVEAAHAHPLSAPAYYRLLLPYVIDPSATRFLYVDADAVIRTPEKTSFLTGRRFFLFNSRFSLPPHYSNCS